MQAVTVASSGHYSSREFINNYNFSVFHQIIHIPSKQSMGAESLIDMMNDFYIAWFVKILHIQKSLNMCNTFFGKNNRFAFFFYRVISIFF